MDNNIKPESRVYSAMANCFYVLKIWIIKHLLLRYVIGLLFEIKF